jgi:hypothetical protein
MKRLALPVAMLICALAAGGCSTAPNKATEVVEPAPLPPVTPPPVTVTPPPVTVTVPVPVIDPAVAELENALRYFHDLRRLSPAALRREQENARQAFAREPGELNRVRFAIAHSLPSASSKEERRALEVLEYFTKDGRPANTPLRSFAVILHTFVAEQTRSANHAQAYKEKLEALKSLERTLSERERLTTGVNK